MDIVKELKALMAAYDIDVIDIKKNDGEQILNLTIENVGIDNEDE